MFGGCKVTKRLCWGKVLYAYLLQSRKLSGADASTALRPFYFAVHPDFFGQYPREREVNENSLKRLNGYLENLQRPGHHSHRPAQLTFYIRETEQSSENEQESSKAPGRFRSVSFTLDSKDLLSTVLGILNSCSLSTDHVQSPDKGTTPPKKEETTFYRPIKWNKSFYAFTGTKDPEEELEQAKKAKITVSLWLQKNKDDALKNFQSSIPLRKELEHLKKDLLDKLQLSDIQWQRSWGLSHRCGQLQSLNRLYQQSSESLKIAKGHTLIFTDLTCMSAAGHIMLGTTDVHHQWTRLHVATSLNKLFESIPSYYLLQRKVLQLQERIGNLLGGMEIVHIEELQPMLTMEQYYLSLDAFCNKLLKRRLSIHPRSLRGLQMILENDRFVPRLHDMGHFSIPSASDPTSLQWFLQTHAEKARYNLKRSEELNIEEQELTKVCKDRTSLSRLYKETDVTNIQMIDCCRNLIEEPLPCLDGLHLCVSHCYSILQDGDLCIPWNWKSKS
ncbi:T-cell activation inhibitor, mitochondrial isoform X1 [Pyxicephalus adspersus]|uniref:T-cell activation inhibitor, mitochondrial isoform X1 n=1 Tax=Pyxicephalus adspersus TaxID=30357 RepID=UPI003B58D9F1